MENKKRGLLKIGLIISEILLIYMFIGNIMYLHSIVSLSKLHTIIISIIEIILTIVLLLENTLVFLKTLKYDKLKEKKKINTRIIINMLSNYIYFLSVLYRMDAYIIYIIATVSMILNLIAVQSLFKNPEENYISSDRKKNTIIKLTIIFTIMCSLIFEFFTFKNISEIVTNVNSSEEITIEDTNETINEDNTTENYDIQVMYSMQREKTFIKFVLAVIYVCVIFLSIIIENKKVEKVSTYIMLIMLITFIFFARNNNIFFTIAQIESICILYPYLFVFENKDKNKKRKKRI